MVKIIKGDLLSADADIICHQVNLQGYMGGGLALSIARKYPSVEKEYRKYPYKSLGEVCFADAGDFIIANCFSQTEDYDTHYYALIDCLIEVKRYMEYYGLKRIAIPYKYGCGIANGNWDTVLNIFADFFDELYVYQK